MIVQMEGQRRRMWLSPKEKISESFHFILQKEASVTAADVAAQ